MDPTMHLIARSVQRAVMSAPTATISDAVEAARRATRAMSSSLDDLGRAVATARPARAAA